MKALHTLPTRTSTVAEINQLHASICAAAKTSLEQAIKIGQLLSGVKAELNHGEWLPWLAKHISFSERTARNYVRIFNHRAELESANVADLSDAYRLLSPEPRRPDDDDDLVINTTLYMFAVQGRTVDPREVLDLRERLEAQ